MKKLTTDQAKDLEEMHNVCIDVDTMQYNRDSCDAVYGWVPIPDEWISDIVEDQPKRTKTMRKLITREQAVKRLGSDAVDAVDAENCQPTNVVGFNGACQGDEFTEWSATVEAAEDGEDVYLTAYYYTSNEDDDAIASADSDGAAIDWHVEGYTISS